MEIKDTFVVERTMQREFINQVNKIIRTEQALNRIVKVQYAPVVVKDKLQYTAFITSGVIGE